MINELYVLSETLKQMNISTTIWYRKYNPLPNASVKSPCLRIWISVKGQVMGIETLDAELVTKIRKYGETSGTSLTFPAFNIKPLYRVTDKMQIKKIEAICAGKTAAVLEEIRSFCIENNWQATVDDSLCAISKELLEIIKAQGVENQTVLTALIHAVVNMGSFRAALKDYIFKTLAENKDSLLLLKMLFYLGDSQKIPKSDNGSNISVVLDLCEWDIYGCLPVANPETTKCINQILLQHQANVSSKRTISKEEKDAFGLQYTQIEEAMPRVKLSGFDVVLRSMFDGQPCQFRYKKIKGDSFPITQSVRDDISAALGWISANENENKYWKIIDKDEIVFSYPSKFSEDSFCSLSILDSVSAEARFESAAANFNRVFSGLLPTNKPENIRIISIRKMDKARSKVVFSQHCSTEWMIKSAEEWKTGCRNIPLIYGCEPEIPFPLKVAKILNCVWHQDGRITNIPRIKNYQGMELLLDIPRADRNAYYMHLLITNAKELFINFRGKAVQLNNLLSLTGLLLYKQGYKKEDYMEKTAFLLGQIFKISDELHTLYCKVVRKEDIPRQLVGSSMLSTAAEKPEQALTLLAQRMAPYIFWAKKYQHENIKEKDKESYKANRYIKLYEQTADKLKLVLIEDIRFSDFDKAQLFIGYLASFTQNKI